MRKNRVLVAMSGGVDSSVACYLLHKRGYECIGATIKTWPKEDCENSPGKACCSPEAITLARDAADKLGIRHYVFDFSREFREKVKDYFSREYESGRTPNPCIYCNSEIKFGLLLWKADELGCDLIASGHYATVARGKMGGFYVKKGKDRDKDQSYFLFNLSQPQLERMILPLGDLTKERVRSISKRLGQKSHESRSSQDICFRKPEMAPKKGKIVFKGRLVMGEHNGIFNYTVGQRKGLGIGYREPLYVTALDPCDNTVHVGLKEDAYKRTLIVDNLNWMQPVRFPIKANAKIRYGQKESRAVIMDRGGNSVRILFNKAQYAPAPGQAVVFYKRAAVLGGGWIRSAEG